MTFFANDDGVKLLVPTRRAGQQSIEAGSKLWRLFAILEGRDHEMQPGDTVDMKGPLGSFMWRNPPSDSLLIATGTGIVTSHTLIMIAWGLVCLAISLRRFRWEPRIKS